MRHPDATGCAARLAAVWGQDGGALSKRVLPVPSVRMTLICGGGMKIDPDDGGLVTRRPEAAAAVADVRPDHALQQLHEAATLPDAPIAATRDLLVSSRSALRDGTLVLSVPAALGGGRLGWSAPAGMVREVMQGRLSELQRAGKLSREDCGLLVRRFGLHGYAGGAQEARALAGKGRQATSNAVNRVICVLASDIAVQPLLPIELPTVDRARREEIVGSVLSTMGGGAEDHHLRRYVHARVRRHFLGDPVDEVPFREARDRQRAHRAVQEWIAVVSDHLDRDRLPWSQYPAASAEDESDLARWLKETDPATPEALSVGGLRAVTARGLTEVLGSAGKFQVVLIAMLSDGYRPLIELTRFGTWASGYDGTPAGELDAAVSRQTRISALLGVAYVVAMRGYHELALAYAGRANRMINETAGLKSGFTADVRFRVGLAFEGISHLQGPGKLDETRKWQRRLIADLEHRIPIEPAEVLAVAQAILRTEHWAVCAEFSSGKSVSQLLEPIRPMLDEAIRRSPAESTARFGVVASRLAEEIGDTRMVEVYGDAVLAAAETTWKEPPMRYDEWYCASPAAQARWAHRRRPSDRDEWRR